MTNVVYLADRTGKARPIPQERPESGMTIADTGVVTNTGAIDIDPGILRHVPGESFYDEGRPGPRAA